MRKLWNSVLALTLLSAGAAALPMTAHAQDTTPPEITFLTPPSGVIFTRMEAIPVTLIVSDAESGLDRTSVVVQAGDTTISIPESEISLLGVASVWVSARSLDLGPATLTATALDRAGNIGTSAQEVEIGCSFESALAMLTEASESGLFRLGVDRHIYFLLTHADAMFEIDPLTARASLEWALESVTRRSRVLGRTDLRANFLADPLADAAAQELEEELLCLLAQIPVPDSGGL